jgi:hypothetical protein
MVVVMSGGTCHPHEIIKLRWETLFILAQKPALGSNFWQKPNESCREAWGLSDRRKVVRRFRKLTEFERLEAASPT